MDYIDEVFRKGGYLATLFPSYTPRPGQIKMARAIDQAIVNGGHVIAEGPTGTGKSLAYAVPAVYHAVNSGRRVCIVTANKNLQRQIFEKDLSDLSLAVPWKFTYAIRKGLTSYLCRRSVDEREYLKLDQLSEEEAAEIDSTLEWAEETDSGDFEESPGPSPKVWRAFSTTRELCGGPKSCEYYDDCFAKRARDAAQQAHIVVTNYHLFFTNIKAGGKVLPPMDLVIFDEAHRAAGIARNFFGSEVTLGSVIRSVTTLSSLYVHAKEGEKARSDVLDAARDLFSRLPRGVVSQGDICSERLEVALSTARDVYKKAGASLSTKGGKSHMDTEAAHCAKMADKVDVTLEELAAFRTQLDDRQVFAVEGHPDAMPTLRSYAIEIGGLMRSGVFGAAKTVVLTSATLAVRGGGGNFSYLRKEMGISQRDPISEIVVDSPFDWPRQAMLVLPKDMPPYEFDSPKWEMAVCKKLEVAVNAAQGRTLGLFTSFQMMEKARDYLRKKTRWTVLAQRDATNRELVQEFQRNPESVLLGTESFSEGISIEGDSCVCVVLDKLPFISPKDPIVVGLSKKRDNIFADYMLPESIISFKQRVGRLIRTTNDYGVIVVLDDRLLTKRYGKQFVASIPPIRVSHSTDEIAPFLSKFRHKQVNRR